MIIYGKEVMETMKCHHDHHAMQWMMQKSSGFSQNNVRRTYSHALPLASAGVAGTLLLPAACAPAPVLKCSVNLARPGVDVVVVPSHLCVLSIIM